MTELCKKFYLIDLHSILGCHVLRPIHSLYTFQRFKNSLLILAFNSSSKLSKDYLCFLSKIYKQIFFSSAYILPSALWVWLPLKWKVCYVCVPANPSWTHTHMLFCIFLALLTCSHLNHIFDFPSHSLSSHLATAREMQWWSQILSFKELSLRMINHWLVQGHTANEERWRDSILKSSDTRPFAWLMLGP